MLYRHWLNLNVHLLWCYQQPIAKSWKVTGPTLRSEKGTVGNQAQEGDAYQRQRSWLGDGSQTHCLQFSLAHCTAVDTDIVHPARKRKVSSSW